jgi:hypothetical protein
MMKNIIIIIALSCLIVIGCARQITYILYNKEIISEHGSFYLEFDVMANCYFYKTDLEQAFIVINYNQKAFGTNIISNSNIEISEMPDSYFYRIEDDLAATNRFLIKIIYSGIGLPFEVSDDYTRLFHVKIIWFDKSEPANISFEGTLMKKKQLYIPNTEYCPVSIRDNLNNSVGDEIIFYHLLFN